MNPCEFSMSVTALANAIANNLSDDDLDLVASILSQLSTTLSFIAVQRQQQEKRCNSGAKDDDSFVPIKPHPLLPLL